ncbi:hypothetical protein [Nonomuraea endophytica]|uniref:hypothetical protein n=1 Tax=Nonomuraea endophytica TaxID=714136 RepID=UPI0037CACC4F
MAYVTRVDALLKILAYRLGQGEVISLPAPGGAEVWVSNTDARVDVDVADLPEEVREMLEFVHRARALHLAPRSEDEVRRLTHGICPICRGRCGEYVTGAWLRCRRCTGQGTVLTM